MTRFPAAAFMFVFAGIAALAASTQPSHAQIQGQWTAGGAMTTPREFHAAVLMPPSTTTPLTSNRVLAMGGVDNNGNLLASAELFSPGPNNWVATGSMTAAREMFAAVVLKNGSVLVAGGIGTGNTVLGTAELFNPANQTWSAAGSLNVARYAHTATLLANGMVLVAGGCSASNCSTRTATAELYNPATNSWSTTGSLAAARYSHAAVKLGNGMVMVIDGITTGVSNTTEIFNPSTHAWSSAANTNAARNLQTATLLADGKVLVAGGVQTRYPMNSAELYDPVANTWTTTGTMTSGRYAHSATLLPDGTVILGGGYGQSISCGKDCTGYIPTASAEIYTESTGHFTAAPGLPRALAYQQATLLKGGQALVSGGIGTTATCCVVVANSQFYTPLSMTFSATKLDFGLLQTGLTSPSKTVTVTDVSSHSVAFTSIAASGDYAENNNCGSSLAAGANCTINITFSPTAAGTRNGMVTLKDNSPGSPKQVIALTGTGETLSLGFTPGTLKFPSIAVGGSTALNATLTNDGSAAVNLTGFSISPADGTFTETNNCPASLAVQQTCTFQVTFTPPDVFTYKATLSVSNSAGNPATLTMSGTGLDGGHAHR